GRQWRKRHARGDMIVTRFADDFIVGFEHLGDAKQFLHDLRERFSKFGLELHPEKTRLVQFGRYAAERRAVRGLGKPETFDFLGFTHICGKGKGGQFWLKRITISKRLRAKLKQVKDQLKRRRHLPIPEQGKCWPAWCEAISPTTPCPATAGLSAPSADRRAGSGYTPSGVAASAIA